MMSIVKQDKKIKEKMYNVVDGAIARLLSEKWGNFVLLNLKPVGQGMNIHHILCDRHPVLQDLCVFKRMLTDL